MLEKLTKDEEMSEETKSKVTGGSTATDLCFKECGGVKGHIYEPAWYRNLWTAYGGNTRNGDI